MKKLITVLALCCVALNIWGQHTLFGNITDVNGEPLPGASIQLEPLDRGTMADSDGFYIFNRLATGDYTVIVSYVGFETQRKTISVNQKTTLDITMVSIAYEMNPIELLDTWATDKTPMSYVNLKKEDIEKNNIGLDVPYLLRWTPSVVVTSDAGTGIGYTGIRIRGSDATRVNVTINGIPYNDAESLGTFWVNLPDFSSSVENIQIQRGVGTSTNGAGAFGATVSLQTNTLNEEAYGEVSNSIGSFNTRKHTIKVGTGLLNGHWAFDGRFSQINSDGYVDRSQADLTSYYFSGGYYGDKTVVQAIAFSGKEVTNQSWYGTPESRITGDEEAMRTHAANNGYSAAQLENLLNSGRTYNFYLYDNQVDNYQQDHYQLHLSQQLTDALSFRGALHYTYGRGYFEQFREGDDFSDYGLNAPIIGMDTIESGDFIRRRWLDNDYYGLTYNFNYQKDNLDLTIGGAYNQYDGDHFGEIIWAQFGKDLNIRDEYYDNVGNKSDFNIFAKASYQLNPKLNLFGDLQYRNVAYQTKGIDNDLRTIDVEANYNFFNPKLGLTYTIDQGQSAYASFAVANLEPVRNDFVDALENETPEHETLYNVELGYQYRKAKYGLQANFYYMGYRNQLVVTGALNDVGSNLRTNVPNSYRMGIELQGNVAITDQLSFQLNATVSQNKIEQFEEVVYDYTNGFDIETNTFEQTDIAFSPWGIFSSELAYQPIKNLNVRLLSKYVSRQFLDNTSDENRQIDGYFVSDLRVDYGFGLGAIKALNLSLAVNNVFDVEYSANGYTYNYIVGEKIVENFYYPQAGIHFLLGLSLKF